MKYCTEPLKADHKRSAFSCGKPPLDDYLHKQAKQDIQRKLAVVFVQVDEDNQHIIGYYTLSAGSVPKSDVPENIARKMPRAYDALPVTLLGRLAVSNDYHGQGNGARLLIDALRRAVDIAKTDLGSIAVIVDPLDAQAKAFYKKFGFIDLPDRGRMFLPMKTIEQSFQ